MPGTMRFWILRIFSLVIIGFAILATVHQCVDAKYMPVRPIWNETWTDRLKRDLLLNYDKFARPAQHFNTTTVTIDITVRHVTIEELKSLMTVHAWSWVDEKMKWNASKYGGLAQVHLGAHEVWQPDIVLYNSAAGSTVDHYGNTHCIVSEDGTILWVPPSQFMVFCDLDLRFWPFDTQVCSLSLGSWTYDGEQIDLQFPETEDQPDLMVRNTEWNLTTLTRERNVARYSCCSEVYIDVTYNLTMKRQSPNYVAVVVTPATAIVFLTLVTFWLPPHCEEKITIAACTTILISLFLIYFNQKLPPIATRTPLIIHFYSCSLYLVSFSSVISITVVNMSKRINVKPLPWRIKQFLFGPVGRVLWLDDIVQSVNAQRLNGGEEMRENQIRDGNQGSPLNNSNSYDDDRESILPPSKTSQMEWMMAALAIDRIAFLLYCLIFIILAISCSI